MKISILSIFPEAFESFKAFPVTKRVEEKSIAEIEIVDIKSYAGGSFRKIDDSPYGGGAGMLIRVDTLKRALDASTTKNSHVVMLSPKGKPYTQAKARELSEKDHIVLIAGHYEGFDARCERYIDEAISIGDYILTGGELAAQVITDSIIRLKEGTLRAASTEEESFEISLLEYPQYTHPYEFDGITVPDILRSGNTVEIEKWRELEAMKETIVHRPDLIRKRRNEFRYFNLIIDSDHHERIMLHKLENKIITEELIYEAGDFIITTRLKGKPLSDPSVLKNRNRVIKTAASALRILKRIDTSFSHGSLTLENIYTDGNGRIGFADLSKADYKDPERDIRSILESIHSYYNDFHEDELLSII